jgi:hypothetical protein
VTSGFDAFPLSIGWLRSVILKHQHHSAGPIDTLVIHGFALSD